MLLCAAALGSIPTFWNAFLALSKRHISIEVFNSFALGVSFLLKSYESAGFIVLMLSFAAVLDWYTQSRANRAVEELLKLKPLRAFCEKGSSLIEVSVDQLKVGDVVVVKSGERIPVDGLVVFGKAEVNQSSISGESVPVEKVVGDEVLSSTLNESGILKVKATRVGKDSTLERMAALVADASKHKSRMMKLADRFAGIFLPIVLLTGVLVYLITKNIEMTAALFLVACADDMAVAIPLAMTMALGRAAKRGVIVKGGEWFDALSKLKILVLDKTGTLTYGSLQVKDVSLENAVDEKLFWKMVSQAERYSEHPVGRAIYKEAALKADNPGEPDDFQIYAGSGVWVKSKGNEVLIGNSKILENTHFKADSKLKKKILAKFSNLADGTQSAVLVIINNKLSGWICVADTVRVEAKESIAKIKEAGVSRVLMFTGDNRKVAQSVCQTLGITEYEADMKPESKLDQLAKLSKEGAVGMIGDGINDAPALARADVGIAMGGEGTAVAVEAADVVILTDDLSRLPEVINLGRRTISVIRGDIVIWAVTNAIGFALVLSGFAGLSIAAFYNFATDFLPLFNSTRLFSRERR